jgi:protease-4
VDSTYLTFKTRVAIGRKKSIAYIDSIAQGRVWTGADALKVGLVDKIGGLNDAIASAVKMAKLNGYTIVEYPEKKSLLEDILSDTKDKVQLDGIKEQVGFESLDLLKQFKSIKQIMGQPQTRLPIFAVKHP